MGEVEVISTCLVGAAERSNVSVSRVELTPWDLQFLKFGSIQKGLLFQKPTPQQEHLLFSSSLIHHLKSSLASTLDFFPPLAGRFATVTNHEDNTTGVFVDCNNAGVEFVHAKARGVTVAAILDLSKINDVPYILHYFFPLNGVLNFDGICQPLMGVQITELLDGYFIGCTLNHCLADGTSFWHFFNCWSELSRPGFTQISTTPILERWFPGNTTPPIHLPLLLPNERKSADVFKTRPFPERVFHLSKENISKLKEKTNSEMGTTVISSLQSYMAHLWRCVTRARGVDSNEDVRLFIIIGTRPRIPLPEGYWGNAAFLEIVTAKAGEVLEKGLGWTALKIKEVVQKQTKEEVMKRYMNGVKSPQLSGGNTYSSNCNLFISSSPRFNVYATDFGWGKPVAVRSGIANKLDGKVTLFAGSEEGSVDMELCIHANTLLGLGNDPEFLDYVTL